MKIVSDFSRKYPEKTALCLGNFDGFHLAHRRLVTKTAQYAKEHALRCAAFTFSPPVETAFPLSSEQEKFAFLESCGVEVLFCAPFDTLRTLPPQAFLNDLVLQKMHARAVFCGYNYTFGYRKEGNAQTLRELLKPTDCALYVMERQTQNLTPISSSAIRDLIRAGETDRAEALLGHPICPSVKERL